MSLLDNSEIACEYCRRKFVPKKRWVQKYCGSPCRVAACNQRAGRAHPLESQSAIKIRRRKERGRTPTAVAANQSSSTNEEVIAAIGQLVERMTALEKQQRQLLNLLLPPAA
ncbi:hypothetical protein FNT36_25035 [Hymenobacter setariae]|uniref:Uncharacterized protein n=1 Tax=Hymenobacter setariae TaxID=2594794 RepID=A0A558BJT9_9BACT|nr:hypothetical protein [Hymenobacter setariae]TVT36782.1 hypothetical protein FNT36_25035 [Hymenobacter setariae]